MSADAFITPDFESNFTFLSLYVRFLLDGEGTFTDTLLSGRAIVWFKNDRFTGALLFHTVILPALTVMVALAPYTVNLMLLKFGSIFPFMYTLENLTLPDILVPSPLHLAVPTSFAVRETLAFADPEEFTKWIEPELRLAVTVALQERPETDLFMVFFPHRNGKNFLYRCVEYFIC